MNVPLKYKLIFILISGLIFVILNGLIGHFFLDINFSWGKSAFEFVFFGLSFGFVFFFLLKKLTRRNLKKIQIELNENEIFRYEGLAILFQGTEKVSGKLLLTNERLLFKSKTRKDETVETQLDLNEIKEVNSSNTAVLFHNKMMILDEIGRQIDFLVNKGDDWFTKLNTP